MASAGGVGMQDLETVPDTVFFPPGLHFFALILSEPPFAKL